MKVNPKENVYFAIKLIVSIVFYVLFIDGIITIAGLDDTKLAALPIVIYLYIGLILLFILFRMGILIGHLKGNAIKITPEQFPDIYGILVKESQALGLSKIPDAYVLQQGGLLNAYTLKFVGTNYVVVYSDVLAEAYKKGNDAATVSFIIGHELGHIKRKHFLKKIITLPGSIIPFLDAAYSRACEYTADNFGAYLSPEGAVRGMMLLAAGPHLTAKVNTNEFTFQEQTEGGFWRWFAEKVSTHPNLTKRVIALNALYPEQPKATFKATVAPIQEVQDTPASSDHTKYMPG